MPPRPRGNLTRQLLAAGAVVSAFDPVVRTLPEEFKEIRLATDIYAAAERADAVLLTRKLGDHHG